MSNIPSNYTRHDLGGTIRNSSDGWHFINDDNHMPVGFKDEPYVTDSGLLVLKHAVKADKIAVSIAVVDESLASLGIQLGTSVSKTRTVIKAFDKDGNFINANKITSSGNIWVSGLLLVEDN